MTEKFVNNHGVQIHYIILNQSSNKIPVVFIPGALVSADDIYNNLKDHIKFYCIIISTRGLGKSGSPDSGYSKEDRISDINAVLANEKIDSLYIMGHSVGAGLAAAYSVKYPEKIEGLIMADYPPGYPSFPQKWADRAKNNFENVNEKLINGMVKDNAREYYLDTLAKCDFKKLILKSGGEDSLLPIELAYKILEELTNTDLKIIDCGHEMFFEKPEEVLKTVQSFIK